LHYWGGEKQSFSNYNITGHLFINFYFYFHHQLAGLDGMLFPQPRKALVVYAQFDERPL
jgi:hypothetical protein